MNLSTKEWENLINDALNDLNNEDEDKDSNKTNIELENKHVIKELKKEYINGFCENNSIDSKVNSNSDNGYTPWIIPKRKESPHIQNHNLQKTKRRYDYNIQINDLKDLCHLELKSIIMRYFNQKKVIDNKYQDVITEIIEETNICIKHKQVCPAQHYIKGGSLACTGICLNICVNFLMPDKGIKDIETFALDLVYGGINLYTNLPVSYNNGGLTDENDYIPLYEKNDSINFSVEKKMIGCVIDQFNYTYDLFLEEKNEDIYKTIKDILREIELNDKNKVAVLFICKKKTICILYENQKFYIFDSHGNQETHYFSSILTYFDTNKISVIANYIKTLYTIETSKIIQNVSEYALSMSYTASFIKLIK